MGFKEILNELWKSLEAENKKAHQELLTMVEAIKLRPKSPTETTIKIPVKYGS